jgi:small subunit ribosomal protein S16
MAHSAESKELFFLLKHSLSTLLHVLCDWNFRLVKEVIENDMAVSMRLMRFGGRKTPFYRIVVSDRRSSRDGRFIEQVGTYDPMKDPVEIRFKEEKAIQWLKKGALPTQTVRQLLVQSGLSKKLA